MRCTRYFLYLLLPAVLLFFTGCKNKNKNTGTPAVITDTNPAYQSLSDSIGRFPDSAGLYLRRAERLTRDGLHRQAYADYHQAYLLEPGLKTALPLSANLETIGRTAEKLRLLSALNEQLPANRRVERLLADAYAGSGLAAKALNLYNEMLRKDSSDPETLYEKAMLLEQMKDTAGAIASLKEAYRFQGVDTYGLELAHLYAEQKNPLALEICNAVLRQDSLRLLIDPLFIKGIYFANMKQYQKAIEQFDLCISRDWKTTDAYLEKGRIYFNMGNFNAALQTFKLAITVSNTDPDAYFWLGRCYEAQHHNPDAISNYQRAISLDKDFTEARQRIAMLKS